MNILLKSKLLIAAVALNLFSVSASAGLINLTQTQDITEDAQYFEFLFENLAQSDGSDGLFIIEGNGDYTSVNSAINRVGEWADVTFENSLGHVRVSEAGELDNDINGLILDSFIREDYRNSSDEFFRATFSISGEILTQLTADNQALFTAQNGDGVQAWWAKGRFDQAYNPDYLSISLVYNAVSVSEPQTIILFASLFALLAFRRQKFS